MLLRMKLKIKPLVEGFITPEYKRDASAGMDIYFQSDVVLETGIVTKVNLGFAAEVPNGCVALLVPRSSAGMKGVCLRNTVGVIDADYRGEWIAMLTLDSAAGHSKMFYNRGDRALQALIVPFKKMDIELTNELSHTGRGEGGFGSTNT